MVDQKIVQRAITNLNKGFTFVAKRHLHSAWVFALLGLTIAFVVSVAYIADSQGKFSASLASSENLAELAGPELTPDYHIAVASGEQTNIVRWDPEYTRIPKDSIMGEVMMAAAVVVGMFAPIVLPAVGITGGISGTVATGISTITGISAETVTAVLTIVRGASTVSNVISVISPGVSYSLPVGLNWGALDTGGLPSKSFPLAASDTLKAAPKKVGAPSGVVLPDINSVKVGNRAIAEITKRAAAATKKLDALVCGQPLHRLVVDNDEKIDAKTLYAQIKGVANEKINDFKSGKINGRNNEVRSIFTIAAISGAAIESMNAMDKLFFTNKLLKQRCPTGDSNLLEKDHLAPQRAQMAQKSGIAKIRAIAENDLAVFGKTAREVYERTDGRNVLDFERAGVKDAVILQGIEGEPLPNSAWIGFKNGDVHGKAAQDNIIMVATDSFVISAMPVRAFIGVRSTDSPVEVRLNGVPANTLKEKINSKNNPPYKTKIFEVGNLVGIGKNRLAVSVAQSAGARAKFALNYVLYVVCEPGVACLAR